MWFLELVVNIYFPSQLHWYSVLSIALTVDNRTLQMLVLCTCVILSMEKRWRCLRHCRFVQLLVQVISYTKMLFASALCLHKLTFASNPLPESEGSEVWIRLVNQKRNKYPCSKKIPFQVQTLFRLNFKYYFFLFSNITQFVSKHHPT